MSIQQCGIVECESSLPRLSVPLLMCHNRSAPCKIFCRLLLGSLLFYLASVQLSASLERDSGMYRSTTVLNSHHETRHPLEPTSESLNDQSRPSRGSLHYSQCRCIQHACLARGIKGGAIIPDVVLDGVLVLKCSLSAPCRCRLRRPNLNPTLPSTVRNGLRGSLSLLHPERGALRSSRQNHPAEKASASHSTSAAGGRQVRFFVCMFCVGLVSLARCGDAPQSSSL